MNSIAAFFAGIMAFISGVFGSHHQSVIVPILQTVQSSTTQSITGYIATTTVATSTVSILGFQKFHNNLHPDVYDFEIQYPEKWKAKEELGTTYIYDTTRKTKDGKNKMVLAIGILDDHHILDDESVYNTAYDNSTSSRSSFRSWVMANFNDNNVGPLKKIIIGGEEAWELPSDKTLDPCYNWSLVYHNGIVYSIYRNTNTCNYDQAIIDTMLSSIKFLDQATSTLFLPKYWNMTVKDNHDNKDEADSLFTRIIYLVHGDVMKTIKMDFGYISTFYMSKDGNFIYFTEVSEKDGAPTCENFYYLDSSKKRYYKPDMELCSDEFTHRGYDDAKKVYMNIQNPYLIQDRKFDYKNLYVANLDTLKESLVYGKKSATESLIASCSMAGYEYTEDIGLQYLDDIERLDNNKVRVGVYKEVGQDTQSCTEKNLGKYEKIRDDIVDLNKL